MKKQFLYHTTVFLLSAPLLMAADQAIYKTQGTNRIVGRGSDQNIKAEIGYWVIEPSTMRLTAIAGVVVNGKKTIQIVEGDGMNVFNVKGANGDRYTSLAKAQSPSRQVPAAKIEGLFALGRDEIVPLKADVPWRTIYLPKRFTTHGFFHFDFGSGHRAIAEGKGTASLDLKASQESNQRNEDHDAVVNRLAARLKAKGYIENPRLARTQNK